MDHEWVEHGLVEPVVMMGGEPLQTSPGGNVIDLDSGSLQKAVPAIQGRVRCRTSRRYVRRLCRRPAGWWGLGVTGAAS